MASIPPELLLGSNWIPKSAFETRLRAKLGMAPGPTTVDIKPLNFTSADDLRQEDLHIRLASALQLSLKDKRDAANWYNILKNHYLLRVVMQSLINDAFYKYVDYDSLPLELPIQMKGPESFIHKVVDFLSGVRFPKIIREILPTTLYLGEYLLFLDRGNKRKSSLEDLQIDDIIDQVDWRAVYLRGSLYQIVTGNQEIPERYAPEDALVFRIRYLSYRTDIQDPSGYNYYYYVGTPIIDGSIFNLINTIRLLESLLPISQILQVQSTQIIHVRVPPGASDLESAFQMARKYERILNSSIDIAPSSQDPNEIIFQAARYRVIPLFGDKGTLEPQDLPRPNPVDTQQITYFKQALSDAIPLPSSYIGVVEANPDDKSKLLSYFSLLDSMRQAIADLALALVLRSFPENSIPEDFDIIPVKVLNLAETKSSDYMELIQFQLNAFADTLSRFGDLLNQASEFVDLETLVGIFNKSLYPMTDYKDLISLEKVQELASKSKEASEFEPDIGPGSEEIGSASVPQEETPQEEEVPSEGEEEKEESPPEEFGPISFQF